MNEKSDNKYNINIFNISYGLQENLGKKLLLILQIFQLKILI